MSTITALGTAELIGTLREPVLRARFSPYNHHPTTSKLTMLDWVKSLPGRVWDPEASTWTITSLGPRPDTVLAEAGLELLLPSDGELAGIQYLEQLYMPVTMLASNRRTVLVRMRLCGYEGTQKLIGSGGVWDKTRRLLRVPVSDVVLGASPRPGVLWDQASIDRSYEVHALSPLLTPELSGAGAALANALEPGSVAEHIREIQGILGGPVGKFGIDLYNYQVVGAYGVAAGHTLLADSPGVGKSFQGVAASAALRSRRLLVICPPVVLTNWAREVNRTGYVQRLIEEGHYTLPEPKKGRRRTKTETYDGIAVFRSGRKAPDISEAAVIVVSDSKLATSPELCVELSEWLDNAPDPAYGAGAVALYDEAHRMKTMGSKRSDAVLDLVARAPRARRIAMTGTPVLASPHELVPILEFTGHLAPVFGGAGPFLQKYCRQDRYGGLHPRKAALGELNRMLNEHVWVRRTKQQVLPQLPERDIVATFMDVPLTEYNRAHKDIQEQIFEWVQEFRKEHGRNPSDEEQEDFAQNSLRFVSQLRQAAGLTKIPAAVEMVLGHLTDSPDAPILVWAHHKVVVKAMADAAREAGVEVGVIDGGTSDTEKYRLVDALQAGLLPVLVCSITAAGVGITLTRSSDALFVECDWTPALILQAIDRQHRIGQEDRITANMLVAEGTLDEHIQHVLDDKGQTLGEILGDMSNSVGVAGDRPLISPKELILAMVKEALARKT